MFIGIYLIIHGNKHFDNSDNNERHFIIDNELCGLYNERSMNEFIYWYEDANKYELFDESSDLSLHKSSTFRKLIDSNNSKFRNRKVKDWISGYMMYSKFKQYPY